MTTAGEPSAHPTDLHDRVALVTGSSSGIGTAIARMLSRQGAAVAVNSATSVAAGQAVAAELPNATYIQADVSDAEQATRLVETTIAEFGRLDIVVNNAGTTKVIPHRDLDGATNQVRQELLSVNLLGTWNVTRAAVPHLRESGDGVVINISSIAGVRPTGSSIPYAVSKAGVNHLTLLLANVLGPEIRVNAVAPGLVDTPWTADWHDVRKYVHSTTPLKRSGIPTT